VIGRSTLSGLREDENMGDTYRGAATSLTEQRTNRMILILSIGIVFTLAVGGFVVVNSYGDQDQSPLDDPQKIVLDNVDFDLAETAQLQALREPDFVMESEIHSQSYQAFSKQIILTVKNRIPYIHLKHKQSIWCYNQSALVYDIFLNPNKCTTEVW
jgi:hypothetical protein